MRIVKYRVWDEKKKQMFSYETMVVKSDLLYECFMKGVDMLVLPINQPNIIKMQFMGLSDKNGKEIYEGDILKTQKYYKGKKAGVKIKVVKFAHMATLSGFNLGKDTSRLEVIGNVYENPELVK